MRGRGRDREQLALGLYPVVVQTLGRARLDDVVQDGMRHVVVRRRSPASGGGSGASTHDDRDGGI
jgi:hypothetical protein